MTCLKKKQKKTTHPHRLLSHKCVHSPNTHTHTHFSFAHTHKTGHVHWSRSDSNLKQLQRTKKHNSSLTGVHAFKCMMLTSMYLPFVCLYIFLYMLPFLDLCECLHVWGLCIYVYLPQGVCAPMWASACVFAFRQYQSRSLTLVIWCWRVGCREVYVFLVWVLLHLC